VCAPADKGAASCPDFVLQWRANFVDEPERFYDLLEKHLERNRS
jgi:hypothetical protein